MTRIYSSQKSDVFKNSNKSKYAFERALVFKSRVRQWWESDRYNEYMYRMKRSNTYAHSL